MSRLLPKTFPLLLHIFWILLFLLPHSAGAVESGIDEKIHENKSSLNEINRGIQQKKEILRNFEKKERNLLATLQAMDQKLLFKEEQLESYDMALTNVRKQKEQMESEVHDLKTSLTQLENYLAYKIVQLYKHGSYSYVKVLFSAGSYTDLLKRYQFLKVMAQKESDYIGRYKQTYADLTEKESELNEREVKIRDLQKAFKEKNREILAKREERTKLLKHLRNEKAIQKELLDELENSSIALQAIIDNLIRQRETLFGSFEKFKGSLSWPVEGAVVTPFGKNKHEEFNTFIFSKGIDIEASVGSRVKAVYNGTVLFADWFKGYGQMLILDHGKGFYTLYAHLSDIMVPKKSLVRKGQTIAKVGETGSLKGPVLYFEIRYHGEPQDPLTWLAHR
jgi:septal ring factor EnvC (AmiA/AmiB activator)